MSLLVYVFRSTRKTTPLKVTEWGPLTWSHMKWNNMNLLSKVQVDKTFAEPKVHQDGDKKARSLE